MTITVTLGSFTFPLSPPAKKSYKRNVATIPIPGGVDMAHDMGRSNKTIKLTVVIAGDNAYTKLQELRAVYEQEAELAFKLPDFETGKVRIEDLNWSEPPGFKEKTLYEVELTLRRVD